MILMQTFAIVLCGWLGGFRSASGQAQPGRLLTVEEVGQILQGTLLGYDAVRSPKPEQIYSAGKFEGRRCFPPGN